MEFKERPYIIGETAFHHQGDLNYLKQLIDAAVDLKLDAIKFHLLFELNDYFTCNHPAENALREWLFSKNEWNDILDYTSNKGIDIIALCNDIESAEWVISECKTKVKAIEIHATGINDVFLIKKISEFKDYIMLGVGGSTIDQIEFAINELQPKNKKNIILMYGFQNYPTDYKDINLSKIELLKDIFKLPVGYADHTDPKDPNNELISVSGIYLGANIIEKHFTLNVSETRIDSQAAVSLTQMERILELAIIIHEVKGNGSLKMSTGEKKYGDVGPMKKAIVAKIDIPVGTVIELGHLAYKRTDKSSYIEQNEIYNLVGLKSLKDISKDEIIDFNNIGYKFNLAETNQFNIKK